MPLLTLGHRRRVSIAFENFLLFSNVFQASIWPPDYWQCFSACRQVCGILIRYVARETSTVNCHRTRSLEIFIDLLHLFLLNCSEIYKEFKTDWW